MEQTMPQTQQTSNSQAPISSEFKPQGYNKESGRKTLFLIGILLIAVIGLSLFSLIMISRRSGTLLQSQSIQLSPSPSLSRNGNSEEIEIQSVPVSTDSADINDIQKDIDGL